MNKWNNFFFILLKTCCLKKKKFFLFSNDWQELGVVGAGPKPLSFLRNHLLPSGPQPEQACSPTQIPSLLHWGSPQPLWLPSTSPVLLSGTSRPLFPGPFSLQCCKKICFFYLLMTELSIRWSHLPLHQLTPATPDDPHKVPLGLADHLKFSLI